MMTFDDELNSIFGNSSTLDRTEACDADNEAMIVDGLSAAHFALHRYLRRHLSCIGAEENRLTVVLCNKPDEPMVLKALKRAFKLIYSRDQFRRMEILHADLPDRSAGFPVNVGTLAARLDDRDVVFIITAVPLDGPVAALVDETLDLRTLQPQDLEAALGRSFSDTAEPFDDVSWPDGVPFFALDLACAKAQDRRAALEILSSFKERKAADGIGTVPNGADLSDLYGYGEAGIWAQTLVDDLKAYRDGKLMWRDVESAALVHGPPGTGKTELARRIAGAAGIPLRTTSYSVWQRSGDGHLGSVMTAIKADFDAAAQTAPSLLFIDEIDALPPRGTEASNAAWFWAVTNSLLEALDGAERREGVFVMAACNHADRVDPALLRPGRLERSIDIGLPSADDLAQIFSQKVDRSVSAQSLLPLATLLAGSTSGADATRIARLARREARMAGRQITLSDMEKAALVAEVRPPEELRRIAIHEAGHALAALTTGMVPRRVTLVSSATSNGAVEIDKSQTSKTAQEMHGILVAVLAGRAAEQVILGRVSSGAGGPATSDLAIATRLAGSMVGVLGFGATLVFDQTPDRNAVETLLGRAYADAVTLVFRHRDAVEALAQLLTDRRVLNEKDLRQFAQEQGLST